MTIDATKRDVELRLELAESHANSPRCPLPRLHLALDYVRDYGELLDYTPEELEIRLLGIEKTGYENAAEQNTQQAYRYTQRRLFCFAGEFLESAKNQVDRISGISRQLEGLEDAAASA